MREFPTLQKDDRIAPIMDREQDTYWQETTNLFPGAFSSFKNNGDPQPVPVHAKIHRSIEEYHSIETEMVPIKNTKGERISFHIQPYVEEPHSILTRGIPPNGYADTDAIGKVQESRVEGFRPTPVGKCQAWYYPADTTVVIWECFLDRAFRSKTSPAEDPNMQKLWQAVETYFAKKFPRADRMVTPFDDPQFQREAYQAFLPSLGYEPVAQAAYGKVLELSNRTLDREGGWLLR
jgi:hypothetical protein